MQWIPCSLIACSGFYAAWPKASRLIAVDSMQRGPMDLERMQWFPCSVVQWILIERSGLHASWHKWILIERILFHAVWPNESQLNAVDSMQHGAMDVY